MAAKRRREARGRPPARLQGKVAVVTGASRGIGLAVAAALAAEGCNLVLSGRDPSALARAVQRVREKLPVEVVAGRCDVRDPEQVGKLFAAARRRFPRIDFLINNAGRSHATLPVAQLPPQAWREALETNLNGMFYCTQAALPSLRAGGAI
ncbi:MAG TPA: SDR family NAD(P)-dependent oxidoreductase, partial [Terriglobales bacterium]|nr:SDR family NAD(P)-dependent oxidoreductase [Terriglobales bacterium]